MRGVVWGSTFQIAISKLDEIIKQYRRCHILLKRTNKSKNNCLIEFENGDVWRACSQHESMRGIRSNIAYIDQMINPIFIDTVIKPCTTALPFQAIHYYQPKNEIDFK